MDGIKRFMVEHGCHPVPGWPVALLRIALGVLFVKASWGKVMSGGDWTPLRFLEHHISEGNTFAFFRPFVEGVAIPNHVLFGYLVAYGELFIGIALILGVMTRLASLFGILMMFSFVWTKGLAFWSAGNYDALWIMMFATLMFCGAGRVLGIDRVLFARFGDKRWLW